MILNQRNPLWANVKIGPSDLTIGQYGCALTCMAEINNDFGQNCTPDQVAAHKDWFNNQGELIWPKVEMKSAVWNWREYKFNLDLIKASVRDPNRRVMVRVNLRHGYHWLKVTGITLFGRIMADDPWSGDNCDVVKRYGPITGSCHWSKRN